MDTSDLSEKTYRAVIIAAEDFHHDLTLQFGVRADSCRTDDEFLNMAASLIKRWMNIKDTRQLIEDIFYEDPPDKDAFKQALTGIALKIAKVCQMPDP